jgi:hypothetical protein
VFNNSHFRFSEHPVGTELSFLTFSADICPLLHITGYRAALLARLVKVVSVIQEKDHEYSFKAFWGAGGESESAMTGLSAGRFNARLY